MDENQELPSDSDSSDEDYVPKGMAHDVSEEESGSGSDNKESSQEDEPGSKRKGRSKKKRSVQKKQKVEEKENEVVEVENPNATPEEQKKRADNLWADFLKDCGPVGKKKQDNSTENERVTPSLDGKENSETEETQPSKVKVTQIFEFAGEKVKVEKEVDVNAQAQQSSIRGRGRGRGGGGGIASILGQLGKKGKLSTLEKSKLDWDRFKKDEGIDEDIEIHNKGKNGYLEKQDFLQRTDLRQFEIEKNMRNKKRSLNR